MSVEDDPRRLGPLGASLAAWATAALVNAVLGSLERSFPDDAVARALYHLFDLGQFLAGGLIVGSAAALAHRFVRRPALFAPLVGLGGAAVGALTLPGDLDAFASGLSPKLAPLVLGGTAVGLGVGLALIFVVARLLARGYARATGPALGLACFVANGVLLPLDYPAIHLALVLVGTTAFAASIAGVPLPSPRPLALAKHRRIASIAGLVALGAGSLATVALPPPSSVRTLLHGHAGSVLPPYLGRLHAHRIGGNVSIGPEAIAWYQPREGLPPVPPTSPRSFPDDGIVLLLSVDAMRADLLRRPEIAAKLPVLDRLRAESVDFTNARAPGTGTVYTTAALFAGVYYSQQYWSQTPFEPSGIFPHEDTHVRFPQLLRDAGVATVTFSATSWLVNDWGCARGFGEETRIPPPKNKKTRFAGAAPVVDAALERLEKHEKGPLFLFIHFLDPHFPYDLSPVKGGEFDRYVGEVALVDTQIGRLLEWVERSGNARRTTVIVTSDHGESFGEHGARTHGTTLYDTVLHVPLIVRAPKVEPRRVDDYVSLIDLGPTILDLYGRPTPASFFGQSLVPYLRGERPRLTRPILAETRLKKSLLMPDGRKVIVDDRSGTVELYDLRADPGEKTNLADTDRVDEPLGLLRHFFEVHTLRRDGYRPPYRP
jgi:hypothetical protein